MSRRLPLSLVRDWTIQTNMTHEDGSPAQIVDTDLPRVALTGPASPFGPNKVYLLCEIYDIGVYRMFVKRSDNPLWWDDALVQRTKDFPVQILETRIVDQKVVAHVAASFGIAMIDTDGNPIYKFDDIKEQDGKLTFVPPVKVQASAPPPMPKVEYTLVPPSQFKMQSVIDEVLKNCAAVAAEFTAFITDVLPLFPKSYPYQAEGVSMLYLMIKVNGTDYWPIVINNAGVIEINFANLKRFSPFDTIEARTTLAKELTAIVPGIDFLDKLGGHPKFPFSSLVKENKLTEFTNLVKRLAGLTLT